LLVPRPDLDSAVWPSGAQTLRWRTDRDSSSGLAEQVKSTEIIAEMAIRLAGLDGVPPAAPPGSEARSRRTAELVADLVEPAKAEALDKVGEGHRAFDVAAGWLRAKLGIDPSP
jgi:hypothetical protein